jgi:opacity protein-like surface antigen
MKRILGLPALLILLSLPAMAQDAPAPPADQEKSAPEAPTPDKPVKTPPKKDWGPAIPQWDLSGAYSLLSYYPPTSGRLTMNGFDGSIDYNIFRRWLAVTADVTGDFKGSAITVSQVPVVIDRFSTSVYTLMVGPRVYPFGHARKVILYGELLFGAGYTRVFQPASAGFDATTKSSVAPAYAAGGGIDYRLSRNWAVQIIEGRFEETRFFSTTGAATSQDNYRFSVGMTYRIGQKK